MSIKRIIISVAWAEALREELPLDQAEVVHFSRENPAGRQPATGGIR